MNTSREAYETAAARNNDALAAWRQARAELADGRGTRAAVAAADDELAAADAALCEQEASPGIPLYTRQNPGYDPPGCARCDATYTELDDDGHCVNSGACRSRAAAREAAKAGARS